MSVFLTSTSDVLRVVTDVDVTVDVHASWIDFAVGSTTPGRTNTLISTASTTEVVSSPAASTYRTLKTLAIRNRSASMAVNVAVVHFDGTSAPELVRVQLSPGDVLDYDEHNGWSVLDQLYGRDIGVSDDVAGSQAVGETRVMVLDRDVTNNCSTANIMQTVTGLAFPVQLGGHRYFFRAVIMYTAAATTTGSRWSIFGESVQTLLRYRSENSATATTRSALEGFTVYDSPTGANANSAATNSNIAVIEGFVDGTQRDSFIGVRVASEVANSAITAKAGSFILWQRVA